MGKLPHPLPWLDAGENFPAVAGAWGHGDRAPGLLAAGAALDVPTLVQAYSQGIFVGANYSAASDGFNQALRARGPTDAQIGVHAGAADTSLMLAVDPARVRADRMQAGSEAATGVVGDPSRASAALGKIGIDMAVDQAVAAIRQAVKTH